MRGLPGPVPLSGVLLLLVVLTSCLVGGDVVPSPINNVVTSVYPTVSHGSSGGVVPGLNSAGIIMNEFKPSRFVGFNNNLLTPPPPQQVMERRVDNDVHEVMMMEDEEEGGDDHGYHDNHDEGHDHHDEGHDHHDDPDPKQKEEEEGDATHTHSKNNEGGLMGGYEGYHYQDPMLQPETRISPFFPGGGGGFLPTGPGFIGGGPAPFDPLPPPPAPLKGSVDYILIPLVLIGIAGPIFVVLYVILGSFEAKLSPITKRSLESYVPSLDTLTSTVGRALDKNECLDYAACQTQGVLETLGYSAGLIYPTIQKVLDPLVPKPYKRGLKRFFGRSNNTGRNLDSSGECSIKRCLKIQQMKMALFNYFEKF